VKIRVKPLVWRKHASVLDVTSFTAQGVPGTTFWISPHNEADMDGPCDFASPSCLRRAASRTEAEDAVQRTHDEMVRMLMEHLVEFEEETHTGRTQDSVHKPVSA